MSSSDEAVPRTFTCDNCGKTFDSDWSDEEAAAEAEGLWPGIDTTDPGEAGVVCDDCFQHLMGRVQAEAPEFIGPGWVVLRDTAAELGITQYGLGRELFQRAADGSKCYRADAGFVVHVKPGCRC